MKICAFSIPEINIGKHNIKDARLDEVDKIVKAKKKTYIQVEVVGEGLALDADCILVLEDARADLILKDMEFVETRLSRSESEAEKTLLGKLKNSLEKEELTSSLQLSADEKKIISGYGLFTYKAVVILKKEEFNLYQLRKAVASVVLSIKEMKIKRIGLVVNDYWVQKYSGITRCALRSLTTACLKQIHTPKRK